MPAAPGGGMGFKLPPLSSLRVFEAAARRGSFKNAAEELNITASAVSHAVQNLEDRAGRRAFSPRRQARIDRARRCLRVRDWQGHQSDRRRHGTIARRRSRGRLTLSSAPGFAARWLMPRLPRFAERHPEISVDIQTSVDPVDLPMEGIDAAIRLAPAARAMPYWTHLLEELLVPSARRRYGKT